MTGNFYFGISVTIAQKIEFNPRLIILKRLFYKEPIGVRLTNKIVCSYRRTSYVY